MKYIFLMLSMFINTKSKDLNDIIKKETDLMYSEYELTTNKIIQKRNEEEQKLFNQYMNLNYKTHIEYQTKSISIKKSFESERRNEKNKAKLIEIQKKHYNAELEAYKEYLSKVNQATDLYKEKIANNIKQKNIELYNAYKKHLKKIQIIEQKKF